MLWWIMGKLSFCNFFVLSLYPWDPGRDKLWSDLVIFIQLKISAPNIQCRCSCSYFFLMFSCPPKLIILILFETCTDCSRLMVGKYDEAKIIKTYFNGINIMSRVVKYPHIPRNSIILEDIQCTTLIFMSVFQKCKGIL